MSTFEIKKFINRHLHGKTVKRERMNYKTSELMKVARMSLTLFKKGSSLARINPPCVVVGDIHGQFNDLLRMFSTYSSKDGTAGCFVEKFVFLGDYVDRGYRSVECITLLLALKIQFPDSYVILRGNHEVKSINQVYGLSTELHKRFKSSEAAVLFDLYNEVFNYMPLAGLVGTKMLCMHGGISPELKSLEDIEKIPRPLPSPDTIPLANDLLWADPMQNMEGFKYNGVRGISVLFGENEVHRLCKDLKLACIVRAHQAMVSGFATFADRKLFTIFTATRYEQMENAGATLYVDKEGEIGVRVLRPDEHDDHPTDEEPRSESASCFFGKEKDGEEKAKNHLDLLKPITPSTSTPKK